MAAEFLHIHPETPEPRKIKQVVECLKDGGIIIYPTDTLYAMGCDIHQLRAVERLCQIKGIKPQKNSFSIICHDLSHIADYARVSNSAFKLMKKALPGPFTFILPATNHLPKVLQTNRKNIGIRVPNNAISLELVKELGNPIITTTVKDDSDDFSSYPDDIEIIYDQNKHLVDIVIEGGWGGITPSTVIDATNDDFDIIREGLGDLSQFL